MKLKLKETKQFKAGDLVMVQINFSGNEADCRYMMVEDALPVGFSPVRQDGDYYSSDNPKEYDSRQYFDNRAVFFVSGPASGVTIRYFLRADFPCRSHVLPASASFMYYPEVNGASGDDTLAVIK